VSFCAAQGKDIGRLIVQQATTVLLPYYRRHRREVHHDAAQAKARPTKPIGCTVEADWDRSSAAVADSSAAAATLPRGPFCLTCSETWSSIGGFYDLSIVKNK
jgi:hypothetical protein